MNKIYDEIKSEVLNLGFEKSTSYSKYETAFIEAFNWAQLYIATTLSPIYTESVFYVKETKYEEVPEEIKEKYETIDVVYGDRCDLYNNIEEFRKLQEIKTEDGEIADYAIEYGRYIRFFTKGLNIVRYEKYPQKINKSMGDYELEIDYVYANILPYLMAYRLWLDDDMSKATLYWNTFEDLKAQIQTNVGATIYESGWL